LTDVWPRTIFPHYFIVKKCLNFLKLRIYSYLFNEFVCKLGFFWYEWGRLKCEWNERFKGPRVPKRVQFTQERVEYNVFLFDDPLKGSKSLKIFKINLAFRSDKLSHLSKSVHIGENSQILTVSNKKTYFTYIYREININSNLRTFTACLNQKIFDYLSVPRFHKKKIF
jgi:hypothetical protein